VATDPLSPLRRCRMASLSPMTSITPMSSWQDDHCTGVRPVMSVRGPLFDIRHAQSRPPRSSERSLLAIRPASMIQHVRLSASQADALTSRASAQRLKPAVYESCLEPPLPSASC
jgi:hypothetical protein